MILVYKKYIFCEDSLFAYQSTHVCMQLDAPFFTYFTLKKI